ncbi:P-loop containing nucleoside triphosphate hydrolase protein [Terfezia claveryi]|nr:P-loop containing nucleoside triphosphate hydrolase protein [Terfezia claveryi]
MNLPVPGLDVVQRLFLSMGLDPTHLSYLGMAFTVLASLGGFLSYAMNGLHSLWSFLYDNCISSATIHSSDQAYLYIMKWLATHRVSTDCRKFCVTSRKNPNSARVKRFSMYSNYHGRAGQDDDEEDDEEDDLGPMLKYNPAPGLSYFWYRRHLVIMQRVPEHHGYINNDTPDETMVLMTIGRSPNLLRSLLAEARAHYLQSESRKTTVYTVNSSNFQKSWDNGRSRASRDISTVIMEDKDKDLILRDTRDYLNPVTARWYAARGLPYRRGYLFYGPPGTGKTSLTLALAGELKLNLYIFNLGAGGGVTDETLGQLFQALPKKCIVLLEDIDCAGIGRREHATANGAGGLPRINPMRHAANNKSQISFSGLLNAIDGVASHEGRILIMTTNHRERLDPALIRPGRVDVQIEFGFANKETIRRVFQELYKGLTNLPEQSPAPLEIDSIDSLAERFSSAVPAGIFTPAELQGFLMMHKHQPHRAVAEVSSWVDKKLGEKKSVGGRSRSKNKKAVEKPRRDSWELCGHNDDLTSLSSSSSNPVTPSKLQTPPASEVESHWGSERVPCATIVQAGKTPPKLSELQTNVNRGSTTGQRCNASITGTTTGKSKSKGRLRRGGSNIST